MKSDLKPELKWARSSAGVLAGVCKGLAMRFGVDVILIRIAFIVSVLFFGFGICFYFILALSLPREDRLAQAYERRFVGVCSRFALRFQFEPGVVRFFCLLLFFSSLGATILFYFLLYFVLPTQKELQKI